MVEKKQTVCVVLTCVFPEGQTNGAPTNIHLFNSPTCNYEVVTVHVFTVEFWSNAALGSETFHDANPFPCK